MHFCFSRKFRWITNYRFDFVVLSLSTLLELVEICIRVSCWYSQLEATSPFNFFLFFLPKFFFKTSTFSLFTQDYSFSVTSVSVLRFCQNMTNNPVATDNTALTQSHELSEWEQLVHFLNIWKRLRFPALDGSRNLKVQGLLHAPGGPPLAFSPFPICLSFVLHE